MENKEVNPLENIIQRIEKINSTMVTGDDLKKLENKLDLILKILNENEKITPSKEPKNSKPYITKVSEMKEEHTKNNGKSSISHFIDYLFKK